MNYFILTLVLVVCVSLLFAVGISLPSNRVTDTNKNVATNENNNNRADPSLNERRYTQRPTIRDERFRNTKPTIRENIFKEPPNDNNDNRYIPNKPTDQEKNSPPNEKKPISDERFANNGSVNKSNNQQPVNNIPPNNSPKSNEKTVLIITLFHNYNYIDSFFSLINTFTYPKDRISVGILEGDSEDITNTMQKLNKNIEKYKPLYRNITLVHKNSDMKLADRRSAHIQLYRRRKIAELRNYVLKETLNDEEYVLWIDSDVVSSPNNNIIELLMSVNKDVVVPNCLLDDSHDARYDANTWILTPEVVDYISKQRDNYFLMNPYKFYPLTWMKTIYEFRDNNKPLLYEIEVDAVGGTMILAKSKVFRSGVEFPTQLFDHCVETEGFGRMAKKHGFQLVGLPNVVIYHAHNR